MIIITPQSRPDGGTHDYQNRIFRWQQASFGQNVVPRRTEQNRKTSFWRILRGSLRLLLLRKVRFQRLALYRRLRGLYRRLPTADDFRDTAHISRELGGAKVLHFTESGEFAPVLSAGGSIAHKVYYLAVCKYENDPDYHLFHLDENLNVVADDCRESLEVCMNLTDAEWLCHKDRK